MTKTFDPTQPVQTRDGRKVRILCTDAAGCAYPIVALVTGANRESLEEYTDEGRYISGSTASSPKDLVNVPVTVTRFFTAGDAYSNFEAANNRYGGRYTVFKVVTEGHDGPVISADIVAA